jgi:hypothetical protein
VHQNNLKTPKIYQFEAKKKIKINSNFFKCPFETQKKNRVLRNSIKKTCKNYCIKTTFQT